MAATSVFPSTLSVATETTGALTGDGTSGNKLSVSVDGDSILVNGSNQIGALIHQSTPLTLNNARIKALPVTSGSAPFGEVLVASPGANFIILPVHATMRSVVETAYVGLDQTPKIYGICYEGDRKAASQINANLLELEAAGVTRTTSVIAKQYIGDLEIESDGSSGSIVDTDLVFTVYTTGNAALTGGNAANSLVISVSYLVLDVSTGLFV